MMTNPRSRTTRRVAALLSAPVLALSVAACGGGDDDDSTNDTAAEVDTTEAETESTESETTEAVATTEAETESTESETTEAVETTEAETESTESETTEAEVDTTEAAEVDGFLFTSPQGDYTAVFPEEPESQTQEAPSPLGGTLTIENFYVNDDDLFIATSRTSYPEGTEFDVALALQGAQDQAIQNAGGTLLGSTDITLQGRPGKEFTAAVSQGGREGTARQAVFLDGVTIFQVIAVGTGDDVPTLPEVEAFFSSFQFTS